MKGDARDWRNLLKRFLTAGSGEGISVAVLNRNKPAFYCVPAKAYEELMDLVDDLELGRIADVRLADGQEPLRVSLDAL
jgi:antitoxin StbD